MILSEYNVDQFSTGVSDVICSYEQTARGSQAVITLTNNGWDELGWMALGGKSGPHGGFQRGKGNRHCLGPRSWDGPSGRGWAMVTSVTGYGGGYDPKRIQSTCVRWK